MSAQIPCVTCKHADISHGINEERAVDGTGCYTCQCTQFVEPKEKLYDCWQSHTCFVCRSGIEGSPIMHADSTGRRGYTSACDTVTVHIFARSRLEALGIYGLRLGDHERGTKIGLRV
jgi:hypothetical protein